MPSMFTHHLIAAKSTGAHDIEVLLNVLPTPIGSAFKLRNDDKKVFPGRDAPSITEEGFRWEFGFRRNYTGIETLAVEIWPERSRLLSLDELKKMEGIRGILVGGIIRAGRVLVLPEAINRADKTKMIQAQNDRKHWSTYLSA